MRSALFILCLGCTLPSLAAGEVPPHPRLLFPKSAEAGVQERIASDPVAAVLRDGVMAGARRVLQDRPCRYEIPDGKRLLGESRRAVRNVFFTAMAWRLGGGQEFRERCIQELDAACALKDWNPSHFLDTGEMATAVAVGYDWLFETLAADQKARYREAMVAKALQPGRAVYEKKGGWTRGTNNWSQVCAAGLALAAMALAEDDPDAYAFFLTRCTETVEASLRFYEPDGVYPEGPGYWAYGTSYHVLFLAMQEAVGQPPKTTPPLLRSAEFLAHATGPTGLFFNFADSGAGGGEPVAAYGWLAARCGQPWVAARLRAVIEQRAAEFKRKGGGDRFFPLHLLWLPPAPGKADASAPLAAAFAGPQPLACFRSSWGDRNALFVAAKGGTPRVSHGQMDVGSFVLDALGVRWVHDLGTDDYNLPGYFGGQRFTYYRLQNLSHNTLVIDGHLQDSRAGPAPLVGSSTAKPPFSAAFDLTPAYLGQAKDVRRTVTMDPAARRVRIADRIGSPAGPVRWAIMTDAVATVDGAVVRLRKQDKEITLARHAPDGAQWAVLSAKPPTDKEKQNDGFRLVVLETPAAPELAFEVEFAVP